MSRICLLLLAVLLTGAPFLRLAAAAPFSSVPAQLTLQGAAEQLADIEGPIALADYRRPMLLIAVVALLLLVLLLFFLWKKRSRRMSTKTLLPHETALLQLIQAEKMLQEENSAAFVTLLDQALRCYLEQRFGLAASQQTADELICRLSGNSGELPSALLAHSENLQTWLQHWSLVKFAGAALSQDTMTALLADLRAFIETTKAEAAKK